jgi:hypothetical protein
MFVRMEGDLEFFVGLRNSPAIYWKGLAFLIGIKMRG